MTIQGNFFCRSLLDDLKPVASIFSHIEPNLLQDRRLQSEPIIHALLAIYCTNPRAIASYRKPPPSLLKPKMFAALKYSLGLSYNPLYIGREPPQYKDDETRKLHELRRIEIKPYILAAFARVMSPDEPSLEEAVFSQRPRHLVARRLSRAVSQLVCVAHPDFDE